MSNRPRIFYWWDTVTIGGFAALMTLALIVGLSRSNPWQPLVVQALVVAACWMSYGVIVFRRWRYVKAIAFTTQRGISVIPAGFVCDREDFEHEVNRCIDAWRLKAPEYTDSQLAMALSGVVVTFRTFPFDLHGRPGLLAGLTYPRSKQCWVGYRLPLATSALGHELSHVIYGNSTGNYSEAAYHNFAKMRGLP